MNPHLQQILHDITVRITKLEEAQQTVAAEREAIAVWLEKECDEQYLADRVRARGFK